MRISPAVKRELPPASSSGARSSTSTRPHFSLADSAAHSAALPPPTTITSYMRSAPAGSSIFFDVGMRDQQHVYHQEREQRRAPEREVRELAVKIHEREQGEEQEHVDEGDVEDQ